MLTPAHGSHGFVAVDDIKYLWLHCSLKLKVVAKRQAERATFGEGGIEQVAIFAVSPLDPWVERHVVPFLDMVPEPLRSPRLSRDAAAEALASWLQHDPAPHIVADWPEDLSHFAMLLVTGPGRMLSVPPFTLAFEPLNNFSTAANSAVPHNALHDARALRDHVMNHLE